MITKPGEIDEAGAATVGGGQAADEGGRVNAADLLLKEIEIVQGEIDRYDNNGLTVKGWCLAVWAGTIAYGIEHRQPLIVMSSLVTSLSFAFVELSYRRYQQRFVVRSQRIEELLATGSLRGYEYAVHRSAVGKMNDSAWRTEIWTVVRDRPQYWAFYALLALFALAATTFAYLAPDTRVT